MQVFLGDMELKQSEKPEHVKLGGGAHLAVNEFPGGNVSMQFFGPKYREITWDGWFEGTDAYDRMIRIGKMRQNGDPVVFKTEKYEYKVIIKEFLPDHRTNMFIPFSITLMRLIYLKNDEEKKDAVDIIAAKIAAELPPKTKSIVYTVKKGDTPSGIALLYLGDAGLYNQILADNKDALKKEAGIIYPGLELVINI